MTLQWTDWKQVPRTEANSRYAAWWHVLWGGDLDDAPSDAPPQDMESAAPDEVAGIDLRQAELYEEFGNTSKILRKGVRNPDFWTTPDGRERHDWAPPDGDAPTVDPDTVIVAVIDRGIALHHQRLLNADQSSRILCAWNQNALWDTAQDYIPFGREYYEDDFKELFKTYSHKDGFDEAGFNTAVGLVDMDQSRGDRDLARAEAHGAGVMDLAAGVPVDERELLFAKKVRVIAVNLPDRITVGLSGAFLEYFTAFALARVNRISRWLWEQNKKNWTPEQLATLGDQTCFPVVVNHSFGKNAGSRQGQGFFDQIVSTIKRKRGPNAPFHVILPVGNDNLDAGIGRAYLRPGDSETIDWMLPPEDQSPNFLEVWTDPLAKENLAQIAVDISTPGQPRAVQTMVPKVGGVSYLMKPDATGVDARPFAAIYLQRVPEEGPGNLFRLHYTICTLATLDQNAPTRAVPSMVWKINLRNLGTVATEVRLMCQTDQSPLPSGSTSLRSWIRDRTYRVYDDMGRLIDSYPYPWTQSSGDQDDARIVRRHGSLNATASAPDVISAAAFRNSDGKPAVYSATGPRRGEEWQMPCVSLPVDAGPVHYGVLTAGSVDGSVFARSGTSFACPMVARLLAREIAERLSGDDRNSALAGFDAVAWLQARARAEDPADPEDLPFPKVGAGRLIFHAPGRPVQVHTERRDWPG